jgi:hypothetical protein
MIRKKMKMRRRNKMRTTWRKKMTLRKKRRKNIQMMRVASLMLKDVITGFSL